MIPRSLREEAGVAEGTLMKVSVIEGGRLLMTPQVTVDRPILEAKTRKAAFRELAQVLTELRQEAEEKGVHKMTKREINLAVTAARRDLKKSGKRSGR